MAQHHGISMAWVTPPHPAISVSSSWHSAHAQLSSAQLMTVMSPSLEEVQWADHSPILDLYAYSPAGGIVSFAADLSMACLASLACLQPCWSMSPHSHSFYIRHWWTSTAATQVIVMVSTESRHASATAAWTGSANWQCHQAEPIDSVSRDQQQGAATNSSHRQHSSDSINVMLPVNGQH